jgi:type I restriction enzyme R subunit
LSNNKKLSERDICTQYVTPTQRGLGGFLPFRFAKRFLFTNGRVFVLGKLRTPGKQKRADYVLGYGPNSPVAEIKAKDNNHTVGDGMQQSIDYAEMLDVPFAFRRCLPGARPYAINPRSLHRLIHQALNHTRRIEKCPCL